LQYFIVQLLQLKLVMGFAVGNNPIFWVSQWAMTS